MEAAIAKEFPNIIHRICHWHVVNKIMPFLNELYVTHEKKNFKEKFHSVLNHQLTLAEFEAVSHSIISILGCEYLFK